MKCSTSISDWEMSRRWLGRSPRRLVAARKSYNPMAIRRMFSLVSASKSGFNARLSAEEAETMVYLPFSCPVLPAGAAADRNHSPTIYSLQKVVYRMRVENPGSVPRIPVTLLAALALATMAGPLSIDTYLPAFPVMAQDLGTTDPMVQLTLTMFMAGMALGQFFIGPMSDSLGRRRLLVASQVLAAVAAFVCALAPDVYVMLGGRLVQGIAGGAGVVLARAVVADLAVGKQAARAFSLMMMINGLAPILAPLIGAVLLGPFGWRSIFVFMGVFNVVAAGVLAAVVRESLPPERRSAGGLRGLIAGIATVSRIPGFLGFAATFWFGFGAMFAYISGSPF